MAIQIIDNFSLNVNKPIDNRFVVGSGNFYTDRDDIPGNRKYSGLRIWDLNDNAPFVWDGTDWINENTLGISGSGTVNYVSKFNSTLGITDSQIYDTSNSVVIGFSNPQSTPPGAFNHRLMVFSNQNNSNIAFFGATSLMGSGLSISSYTTLSSPNDSGVRFTNNSSSGEFSFRRSGLSYDYFKIASNGNIGIGNFSTIQVPDSRLHVKDGNIFLQTGSDDGIILGSNIFANTSSSIRAFNDSGVGLSFKTSGSTNDRMRIYPNGDITLGDVNQSHQNPSSKVFFGSDLPAIDIERLELLNLIEGGDLYEGQTYHITDSTQGDIWVKAISKDGISIEVIKKFYVVPNEYYTRSAPNSMGVFNGNQGNDVEVGQLWIWGGRLWECIQNGTGVTQLNDGNLDFSSPSANFTKLDITDERYDIRYLKCIYDIEDDWICKVWDWKGNYIGTSPGNPTQRQIVNSDICDWGDESIYDNNNGWIYNNSNYRANPPLLKHEIIFNSNNGDIFNNSNTGNILGNSNNGSIFNNSNTDNNIRGHIQYNSNNGNINDNSNRGNIDRNSNRSSIRENSNTWIESNSNNGQIFRNSNNGRIQNNSNNGSIIRNDNEENTNGIFNIASNSNNGDIRYNRSGTGAGIFISNNQNNGRIGDAGSTHIIRTATVEDPLFFK